MSEIFNQGESAEKAIEFLKGKTLNVCVVQAIQSLMKGYNKQKEVLDFYGVEILDSGDFRFKPSVMDKLAKRQRDDEFLKMKAENERLRNEWHVIKESELQQGKNLLWQRNDGVCVTGYYSRLNQLVIYSPGRVLICLEILIVGGDCRNGRRLNKWLQS